MEHIPFFIESEKALATPESQLCTKVRMLLIKKKIFPVPSASTLEELQGVLGNMRQNGQKPAIFVVNTFGSKEIIMGMDPLVGETPVLFLRRMLFAGQSGLGDFVPQPGKYSTMHAIGNMTLRLTSIWHYGARNSDQIAQKTAIILTRFLEDLDFSRIERENSVR